MEFTLMAEPKKVYITMFEAISMNFTLPSGLDLRLRRNEHLIIRYKEDAEFLAKQKGVAVRSLDDKEFRKYFTPPNNKKPHVLNATLTKDDAERKKFATPKEIEIVDMLKAKGYIVYKKKEK